MKRILAGKIVKPQGIKGEVKLLSYVDAPEGFASIKMITAGGKSYAVTRARANRESVFLSLEGVSDRNAAEELRGVDVYVDAAFAAPLKKGEYFVDELIGLDAFAGECHIGSVKEIIPNRSADIIVIGGAKTVMLPFLKKAIAKIDLESGKIVFFAEAFKEIAYED